MIAELVTVTTTPQIIAHGGTMQDPRSVLVRVPTGGATVYLGGAAVDATDGYPLAAGETFSGDIVSGDDLWVMVAAATQAVNVLRGE